MKAKEVFGFEIPKYSELRDVARDVIGAYQNANRFMDTVQEYVYIEQGMPNTNLVIHNQAHEFPKRFDSFADMLHERHLMAEYPATPELDWKEELKDMDDVFSVIIRIFDEIHDKLENFHEKTDNAEFREMALFAEELMLQNSHDYTKFIEMWEMWDNATSKTSYDNWVKKYLD